MIFTLRSITGENFLLAVRDVGGALPQQADHTPALSHGAHRPGIHAAGGDDTAPRARRADSLPHNAAPALFDFTPPSGGQGLAACVPSRESEYPEANRGGAVRTVGSPAAKLCDGVRKGASVKLSGPFDRTGFHFVRYLGAARVVRRTPQLRGRATSARTKESNTGHARPCVASQRAPILENDR